MKSNELSTYGENTKRPVGDRKRTDDISIKARVRRRPMLALGALTVTVIYFFSHWSMVLNSRSWPLECQGKACATLLTPAVSSRELVPFEAHIMSKCPDAKDCLKMMVLPAMQRVIDKVNFTLSYIGTPTENDGVSCMHGPEECMGNIVELCAAHHYPDPKIYLGFTMCLSRDYPDIPQHALVEDCALEHGIDLKTLDECAVRDDGGFGMGMLRDSVRRSTDAGVTKSCTVRVNEETYCIRDGGKWSDCPSGPSVNDLVVAIEKLYRS